MEDKFIGALANSSSAVETVKRIRPSALFLGVFVFGLAFVIRFLFSGVGGYTAMVWIWFVVAIVTGSVAIWAYKVDMSAFTKSNLYLDLVNKITVLNNEKEEK